jgi:predicted phosphohydrolase
MRLVIVSDTHLRHGQLIVPDGDVFIHCGDMTMSGGLPQIQQTAAWLKSLPHAHKIVIAGNHDWGFADTPRAALTELSPEILYLQDSGVVISGVYFWGSPWQPWFNDWAFNLPRGTLLAEKWAMIPAATDVLITHGPPWGILDHTDAGKHEGCADLSERLAELHVKVHAFGHIHEASGEVQQGQTHFVNASICDALYRPTNPCRVVDL